MKAYTRNRIVFRFNSRNKARKSRKIKEKGKLKIKVAWK